MRLRQWVMWDHRQRWEQLEVALIPESQQAIVENANQSGPVGIWQEVAWREYVVQAGRSIIE